MNEKVYKSISIIGLGWLGLPLAQELAKHGYMVKGSTTSDAKLKSMHQKGIRAYKVLLSEEGVKGQIKECLADTEILILNIPPGLRKNPNANYVKKIENLLPFIKNSSIKKVLYIGSTSVFAEGADFPTILNTTSPNAITKSAKQLISVERILENSPNFKTTILRFSGLVNDERHPVRMMSQRKQIPNPQAPVNLIHLNDCIGLIFNILNQNRWGIVLNASFPDHPSKLAYYSAKAKQKSLSQPDFNRENTSKGKIIDGSETAGLLDYSYSTPI